MTGATTRRARPRTVAVLLAAVALACSVPTLPPIPAPSIPGVDPLRAVSVLVLGPEGRVADAKVCAARPGGEERCATSGREGQAVLEVVPGTYAIRATPPEGRRLEERIVTVEVSGDHGVTVILRGRSTIAGTVRDPEGRGVRGAEACAHATTSEDLECARSGPDGGYVIEIPPGIHKISYSGPVDGSRLMPQWARARLFSSEADLIDTRAKDVAGIDVTLVRGIVLSGTVTAARGGEPVEAAQVCTYPLSAPLGWTCESTDRRGRYSALREPGQYWVWTIPPGVRGSRLMYQRHDRVLRGVDATAFALFEDRRLDVALTEGVVVSGRVTTTDGAPVVVAFVCMDTPFPTGRICRSTGDDGSYELATRPETYVLSVIPPYESDVVAGYWPGPVPDWTKAQRIRVAGDTRVDVVLPRGPRLYGTVRAPSGAPLEGATINLNDATGPRFFGVTDVHGRYSVAAVPGTYTVDVFAPRLGDFRSVQGETVVIEGDTGYDVVIPFALVEP